MLKKEGFFGRDNLIWGFGAIVFFSLLSVVLLKIPCNLDSPLPFSFCYNTVLFGLINLVGGFITGILGLSNHPNFHLISIGFSIPVYYLVGILLKNIFRRIHKSLR